MPMPQPDIDQCGLVYAGLGLQAVSNTNQQGIHHKFVQQVLKLRYGINFRTSYEQVAD